MTTMPTRLRKLDNIKKDAQSTVFISDGSSGSDKIVRLLQDTRLLVAEVERLRGCRDRSENTSVEE